MTVIAYRDGVMAADGGMWGDSGSILVSRKKIKMYRIHEKFGVGLVGCCGRASKIVEFINWYCYYGDKPAKDDDKNFWALIAQIHEGKERCCRVEYDFAPYELPKEDFYAIGGNADFVMGALAAGASAEEAVRLAILYGDSAAGEIQVERLTERT